jgi:hypothetical protein
MTADRRWLLAGVLTPAVSGALPATAGEDDVYTLYRNSVLDPAMRIHVATFDTGDGREYNDENCNLAADLFQHQDGLKTRFWCELGRYHG